MTSMKDSGLRGRVAMVTGANHGIGAAIARSLAEAGCSVFIHFLRISPVDMPGANQRMQDAAQIVNGIRSAGGRAEGWEADLADVASIPVLFDRAEAAFGGVEIVVNNAAVSEHDTFDPRPDARDWAGRVTAQLSAESHDRHFAVNTRAIALMIAEQARRHVDRGANWGRIINVSTDGSASFPGEVSYGASKYAMESYSRAAAWELGPFGITVNVVSPGPTDTGWITPEMVEGMRRATPLGRVGTPEDIADVVVFLASEQARWITGQLHFVGGGHRMI
jgi:3-oxoacyl-[acyl-carrier protein] reductase